MISQKFLWRFFEKRSVTQLFTENTAASLMDRAFLLTFILTESK